MNCENCGAPIEADDKRRRYCCDGCAAAGRRAKVRNNVRRWRKAAKGGDS